MSLDRLQELLFEDKYSLHVPGDHPAAQHPDDPFEYKTNQTHGSSSAGQHMALTEVRVPSQQGTHFDNPYHYKADGSQDATGPMYGAARIVDLREFLARQDHDGMITASLIAQWEESMRRRNAFKVGDPSWNIVGVRTLDRGLRTLDAPLEKFPYWSDPLAVLEFLSAISRNTGIHVKAILNEPASVDEREEGHLLNLDPETGRGGAHGAFDQCGVAIGEFFDLSARHLVDGSRGLFIATRLPFIHPDMTGLARAQFLPVKDGKIQ